MKDSSLNIGSVDYRIYPESGLYVAICLGDISFTDLHEHVDELMNDPDYYVGLNAVYDFTRVNSITGQVERFEQLAEEMSDEQIIDKTASTAILINRAQSSVRQMMQGYLLMTSGSNIDFRIFDETQPPALRQHVGLASDFELQTLGITIT